MKIINIANILFLFIVKAGVGNAFTKRQAEVVKAFTKRKDDPMDRLVLYIILGSLSNVGVFTLRVFLAPIIVMVGAILFAQK